MHTTSSARRTSATSWCRCTWSRAWFPEKWISDIYSLISRCSFWALAENLAHDVMLPNDWTNLFISLIFLLLFNIFWELSCLFPDLYLPSLLSSSPLSVLQAFVENNPSIRWCPVARCERAVRLTRPGPGDNDPHSIPLLPSPAVDCGKGHLFCW